MMSSMILTADLANQQAHWGHNKVWVTHINPGALSGCKNNTHSKLAIHEAI